MSKEKLIGKVRELQRRLAELEKIESQHAGADESVRRERDLLGRIMETSPAGIVVLDPDGRFVFANAAVERVLGLDWESMVGRSNQDPAWHVTDYEGNPLPEGRRPFRKVLSTGRPVYDEHMAVLSAAGRRILLLVNAAPLIGEGGGVERVVMALEDVTSRVRAHEALRDSEERFRRMAESIRDGLAIIEDGRLVYSNERLSEMLGYSREELMGMTGLDYAAPEERERIERIMAGVKEGKEELTELEFWIERKDGARRCIRNRYSISRAGGRVTGRYIITTDITQRMELEEQLRQSQKMEAIGNLAGGIAHDFNNLLTAIIGYSDLFLGRFGKEEPGWADCAEIRKAAERATSLTRQLLAFSRRQMFQPKVIDPNRIVSEMREMLARVIGEDIRLVTELEPDLPAIHADSGQMEQVILNLAINARDAMPRGGTLMIGTKHVTLDHEASRAAVDIPPGEYVLVTVADTGSGMDEKVRSKIFEPFFSTKEAGRGTGLGLSTVYGIVKQHRGAVAVSSEPGGGATFDIHLPVYRREGVEAEEEAERPADLEGAGQGVLIVEDDDTVRRLAARILNDHGYSVYEASTAEEAADLFDREGKVVELVFADIVLPRKTGLELAIELAGRKPELRILLSSGYSDRKVEWTLIEERGYHLLQKPYAAGDLLRAVKETLR